METKQHRLCLVAEHELPDNEAEELVERAAANLGVQYARIEWGWTRKTPTWYSLAQADQVEATLRDAGPEALYLVIEIKEYDSPDDVPHG